MLKIKVFELEAFAEERGLEADGAAATRKMGLVEVIGQCLHEEEFDRASEVTMPATLASLQDLSGTR